MSRAVDVILQLTLTVLATTLLLAASGRVAAAKDNCLIPNGADKDLLVDGPCDVPAGQKIAFRNVNIIANGVLNFLDGGDTHFWAQAILVENGGTLKAGTAAVPITSGRVTIHLYGPPQGKGGIGVKCKSAKSPETCGAPNVIFYSNAEKDPKDTTGLTPLVDPNTHQIVLKKARRTSPNDDVNTASLKVKNLDRNFPVVEAAIRNSYPGVKDDYFYPYHPLPFDDGDHNAYFGYKALGVGYGGTLQLFGAKGGCFAALGDTRCDAADFTGRSWVRLSANVVPTATSLTVEVPAGLSGGLNWKKNDFIVLTSTDYLPGHSELLQVGADVTGNTITLSTPVQYHHNGTRFPLDNATNPGIASLGLSFTSAETRAAVGLLSRNIRIVSEGDTVSADFVKTTFPAETSPECTETDTAKSKCYFGGHTVFRQGFQTVQIQGVEFFQMGQGGRLGHYPIHFHHARKTHRTPAAESDDEPVVDSSDPDAVADAPDPLDTFVMDSSIWDSMTRWIVLHGTQDVTLARNVGFKSIGHGFYLEDATETNNKLLANLGVFARAAVANKQNPRLVPGILAAPDRRFSDEDAFPYKSDVNHPTVFWITNGWNDFQHNAAVGAGACGTCYWFVSAVNSTSSRLDPQGRGARWESYASMQTINPDRAGTTPLKTFIGNFCSAAMTSFQTVTATAACHGVATSPFGPAPVMSPIVNTLAPNSPDKSYYPDVHETGGRFATRCVGVAKEPDPKKPNDPLPDVSDCSTAQLQPICASGANLKDCVITELNRYTTSFNWAPFNFAAIWLRPQWYLLTDSVITDVQQAGLTMVTGGGYSSSDVITGHWALVRKSAFIGHTQPETDQEVPDSKPKRTIKMPANPFASNGGPFNSISKLFCDQGTDTNRPGDYCGSVDQGITFQLDTFGMYQRLFSVYDGPAYQDSNAYLNITSRVIDDCTPQGRTLTGGGLCDPVDKSRSRQSAWWAGYVGGLPRAIPSENDPSKDYCYMPNAAIGWKQPNGFYYPPAFHSTKLFFQNVETRHFVVTPLFEEGKLEPKIPEIARDYCHWGTGLFNGFTSIDRQTVLNDDDGTLTGYKGVGGRTIAVNLDDFFSAPVEAIQCASDNTSKTSPYDYFTTVVYPRCATRAGGQDPTCAIDPGVNPDKTAKPNPHAGDWDAACANERCYGIPLYRLDLAKSDKGSPKVIRMAGQATGQRSTLTVNHGTYYLDTQVSKATQLTDVVSKAACPVPTPGDKPCNINVFRTGQVYYVFLIYAKADTTVTYRFYVGPGATDAPATELDVNLVQADIGPNPVVFKDAKKLDGSRVAWVDKAKGIVEVVLSAADLPDFAGKVNGAREEHCQPTSYCTWDKDAKTCKGLAPGTDDVCKWAGFDPHCPQGGCVGFRFTMPQQFATSVAGVKPADLVSLNLTKDYLCSDTNFNNPFSPFVNAGCPAEKPPVDDRLELNFANVTPATCQDHGRFIVNGAPLCTCGP